MTTKICSKCKEPKDAALFDKNAAKRDGLQSYCKKCNATRNGTTAKDKLVSDLMKDKLTRQREEVTRITQYATEINRWAVDEKHAYERDTNEAHDFFTVSEVCEHFNISERYWGSIKDHMLRLGFALGFEPFKGHYIGAPGSQSTIIVEFVKRTIYANERLYSSLEATQSSREWDAIRSQLEETTPMRLDKLPQLLQGAGIKVSARMERLLTPPATD